MRIRRPRKASVVTGLIILMLTGLSVSVYFLQIPVGAQLYSNLTAPTVQGSIDLNNPGAESFWSGIPVTSIPLTPSVPYQSANGSLLGYGGMVPYVNIKMATNQTHMLIYATWSDPTESRSGNPNCFIIQGTKQCLESESYPGLFYTNATYAYEDRFVIWWNLDSTVGPPPCMTKTADPFHGEGESIAGTGNLWHWKAGRTDSLGAKYGKLKFGAGPNKGQTISPPYSYAANEFINTTGHYVLGWDQYPTSTNPGNFTIGFADNIHQTYDPYLVAAHGVHDNATATWRWVAARRLTTTPSLHIVQFQPGQTYYFALAAFDGGPIPIPNGLPHPATEPLFGKPFTMYGENEETKSISTWFTMTMGSGSGSSAPYVFGSFETAALISLGMIAVGFVAGVVVITRFVLPRKPKA